MSGALPFIEYPDYCGPQYRSVSCRSLYIPMRDGVRIAADLVLPKGLDSSARIPTLLVQTRYWRGSGLRRGLGWLGRAVLTPPSLPFLARHGYAVLYVDVRGTGASFGSQKHPWSGEEVRDGYDLAEWIVRQPWSNGMVGGYGTSYDGTAAELLTTVNHPAVKAVLVRHNEYDSYLDIAFPGGIFLESFMTTWSQINQRLDANIVDRHDAGPLGRFVTGVKPVDADPGRVLLRQAVREHENNIPVARVCAQVTFRDDVDESTRVRLADFNVSSHRDAIQRSGAVVYGWGGWFDAGSANAVLRRFMTLNNRQLAVVGPWNHGSSHNSSPYGGGTEDTRHGLIEYLRFFDCHLKGIDTGVMDGSGIRYYTVGEARWKTTTVWPPKGVTQQRWFLGADRRLSTDAPDTDEGEDAYTVDWEATTGTTNRWHTQMSGCPVSYPNRQAADERLLTYTSRPLVSDIEITGHPVVSLYVRSSHEDGALFAYLEQVDPNGDVAHLTEGQLRVLHRAVSKEPAPFACFGPYHSFKRQDALPLQPGVQALVEFDLLPISVRVPKGHRLRLAIAGADKDTFKRVPDEGTPQLAFGRNRLAPSCIHLPVLG